MPINREGVVQRQGYRHADTPSRKVLSERTEPLFFFASRPPSLSLSFSLSLPCFLPLKEKKQMRRRAAGIEIDFGRVPLLKGEDRGAPRTDKSRRSDLTRIRESEGRPRPRRPDRTRAGVPGQPWTEEFLARLPTTVPRGTADSPLLLAPTPRRRASRYPGLVRSP